MTHSRHVTCCMCHCGNYRLADRRQRKFQIDGVDLLRGGRHPPDHTRRFVLADGERADVTQDLQARSSVPTHSGEQRANGIATGHLCYRPERDVHPGDVKLP